MQTFEAYIPVENEPDLIAEGSCDEGLHQLRTRDEKIVAPEDFGWTPENVEFAAQAQWYFAEQAWLDEIAECGSLQEYQALEAM